tara:strand:- start:170 stop:370 length:201 start_codon:yes stop_codon:yes gene_type:complete
MWMPIVMICANIYANTCTVVTSVGKYYDTKEECFQVSIQKATAATDTPQIFYARPMCQEIVLGQEI